MKKIDKSVSGNIKTITFVAALCLSLALHTGPACLAQQIIQSSQSFTDMANHDHQPCITKEIREKMEARTRTNINRLTSQGVITGSQQKATVVTETFAWPLTYNSNFYDNEYYYIYCLSIEDKSHEICLFTDRQQELEITENILDQFCIVNIKKK